MVEMLVSGMVLYALDQTAKRAGELRFADGAFRLGRFLTLRPINSRKRLYNSRVGRAVMMALWVAAFLSTILLALDSTFSTRISLIAIGAALGGALSNLRDILKHRAVRDFIDLGWWPVFNIADVGIVGGLATAFIAR